MIPIRREPLEKVGLLLGIIQRRPMTRIFLKATCRQGGNDAERRPGTFGGSGGGIPNWRDNNAFT